MRSSICFQIMVVVLVSLATASPGVAADPPRMLMITQSKGYEHQSVKRTTEPLSAAELAMTMLGRQSGEFVVDCSQDAAATLTKENLQHYDIVTFYTSGDLPISGEVLEYLLRDWLTQEGHGFLGFHSASDTFNNTELYWDFIGGTFDSHPWTQDTAVSFAVHDTTHPAMTPFGEGVDFHEEIYQYKHWQPEKVRVLMSLDMAATNLKRPYHVPVAWCKQVGQGRMFYNNMGHREDTWQNEKFLQSILGAARWVVGKAEGSAEPNPDVSKAQHELAIREAAQVGITPAGVDSAAVAKQALEAKKAEQKAEKSAKELASLTWTDPAKAAAEDPDFSIQGEYGSADSGAMFGVQVVALGGGRFDCYVLEGGLPGLGWNRQKARTQLSGVRTGSVARLTSSEGNFSATILDQTLQLVKGDRLLASLPRIERKSPTLRAEPPAGAIVLFDGSSAEAWENGVMEDGLLRNADIVTKEKFQDYHLHLEFRTPYKPYARGQQRGNSGVYHQGRFETQVLDSFGLEGQMNETGGIYTIAAPRINMCLPPLTWQTYDVDFVSAQFDSQGELQSPAKITVKLNGVVVHQDQELRKTTTAALLKSITPEPGPIYIQHHGNPVYYRNVWIVRK